MNNILKLCLAALFYMTCIHSAVSVELSDLALPQHDNVKHLGVASCAASMCHGSAIPRTGSDVLQNEYVIWSKHDAHAQAYQTLLTPASKKIADKLGLANAHQAKVCLDCHADNVKKAQQGEKFQISDGVGCESCHGGGEQYITSHTNSHVARADTIQQGLYPSDQPEKRAQLCLSCHLGNESKYASHDIMGAGHPRLAFELDTFGILQPLHYVVDDDYKGQKWSGDNYTTWLVGQFEASRSTLNLIKHKLQNNLGLFPEIALFDCHSCHHSMSDMKWNKTKGQGFKPGTIRLNDGNFKMLSAVATATPLFKVLPQHFIELGHAINKKQQLPAKIKQLQQDINQLDVFLKSLTQVQQEQHATAVLKQILLMGSQGEFSDYIAAEQAVMAVDLLLVSIKKDNKLTEQIKHLYSLVENEHNFNDVAFRVYIAELQKKVLNN